MMTSANGGREKYSNDRTCFRCAKEGEDWAAYFHIPKSDTNWGGPFFLRIFKIREIIYRPEGVCGERTYSIWRNELISAWWTGGVEMDGRRCLAISEQDRPTRIPGPM